ncbi:MAG: pyrroline-5-carboxylate reductase [Rhodobiaceae bacterium]|nr:pyrroline-5-carboxylate reductase [Rhodobiaceae bacterium]MCC0056353.1 pyrroline-5-carboxylate reductase [Rhodobiaceae bacterium]
MSGLDGRKILLAGAGKMGGALLRGWLAAGVSARDITVIDPAPSQDMASYLIVKQVALNPPKINQPDVAVIAVKPQMMDEVLPAVAQHFGPLTMVVSIAAGTTIESLAAHVGERAIVRAMPNTPAAIGRGISVLVANDATSDKQRLLAESLLAVSGKVEWIDDESLMDAVTAVSGSGPAYVFLLAECLAAAGIKAGLEEGLAVKLARETVAGAGELLHRAEEPAAVLRENVTSPGGTTAAALQVLMAPDNGLPPLMEKAVAAAKKRGRELAG